MPQTYTCLHYHLVFSTKNRTPFITAEIQPRLWEYMGGIVKGQKGIPIQIGGIEDHVHLLALQRSEPSKASRALLS
jgi:REP element-mobilizing transposase RayT